MAMLHRSRRIEGVAAPRQTKRRVAAAECELVSAGDFYRNAVTLFGGSGHGLGVGVILDAVDGDMIEVFGFLPPGQRAGLRRTYAYWEPPRRGWVPWNEASYVWHASTDGRGPCYAIHGLGRLLDLVAERRLALEGVPE